MWSFNLLIVLVFTLLYLSDGMFTLPSVWSNGVVIQRNKPVELVGTSDSPVLQIILIDPNGVTIFSIDALVDPITSMFDVVLPPQDTNMKPFTIEIKDDSQDVVMDVYFGDVILCSGQSNMELPVHYCYNSTAELAATINFPNIRVTGVPHNESLIPLNQTMGPMSWAQASPSSIQSFSAVCWYTARDLSLLQNSSVVIGLIDSGVGGTRIESWTGSSESIDAACGPITPRVGANQPYVLNNAMIHPLAFAKLKFTAVLWYQGEENASNATNYACRFSRMIEQWRSDFNDAALPFHFVLLGPIIDYPPTYFPTLRMSQLTGLSEPYTAVVPAYDLGDVASPLGSVHFRDKQPVGHRLALSLWNKVYGHKDQVFEGPLHSSVVWPEANQHAETATVLLLYAPNHPVNLGLHLAPTENCTLCCSEGGSAFKVKISNNHIVNATVSVIQAAAVIAVTVPVEMGQYVVSIELDQLDFPECVVKNSFGIPSLPFIFNRLGGRTESKDSVMSSV